MSRPAKMVQSAHVDGYGSWVNLLLVGIISHLLHVEPASKSSNPHLHSAPIQPTRRWDIDSAPQIPFPSRSNSRTSNWSSQASWHNNKHLILIHCIRLNNNNGVDAVLQGRLLGAVESLWRVQNDPHSDLNCDTNLSEGSCTDRQSFDPPHFSYCAPCCLPCRTTCAVAA